jgi:hypothetical protein
MVPAQIEQVKRIHDTFTLLMRISKRWFVQRLQNYNLTLPQFTTLAAVAAHDRTGHHERPDRADPERSPNNDRRY